jgi:predicted RNA-binding protein YlqC (UPF0109 family)
MQRISITLLAAVVALVGLAPSADAKDGSKAGLSMARVGTDADIEGSIRFRSSSGKTRFDVSVRDASEGALLTLRVGGVERDQRTAGKSEGARFSFASGTPKGGTLPLSFEPRGELIEVLDGDGVQLQAMLAPGGGSGGSSSEAVTLVPTGVIPGASGHARIVEKKGVIDFDVEIEDVPNGSYDLFVAMVDRGDIIVSAGRGEIEFSDGGDDPDELPLTFDPYGALIEVKNGAAQVVLSGDLLAGGGVPPVCSESDVRLDLVNVGPDPDAKGDARHRVLADCDRAFQVEVEDLADGAYELFVGGVDRGDVQVTEVAGEHRGEIEFHTDPSEVGKVLLTFDPRGQTIEVKQGATTFLSLDFPG